MSFTRNAVSLFFLMLAAFVLEGCASLDVSHLEQKPWKLNSSETVSMEFMKFEYQIVPRKDSFGMLGCAFIKKDAAPVWATWLGELWIQGYLSDADGHVLAKGLQVFSPRELEKETSIPFDFELKPDRLDAGPLFVSFGYRMVLQRGRHDSSEPFMAIERAVTH